MDRKIITRIDEPSALGMDFSIIKLDALETLDLAGPMEHACLLLNGEACFIWENQEQVVRRSSLFDQAPAVIHFANSEVSIQAKTQSEFAVFGVRNADSFSTMVFDEKNMLENEHRGKGKLEDTAYRIVRTVFDKRNRPDSNLVLGEVVNFPGRWSSYPPHHHTQPELYHYRFSHPHGYGHGELGDDVYKVKDGTTLIILDNKDHAQVAAPGYKMYYLWAIRHLPGNPYVAPEFTKEHLEIWQ